MNAIWLHSSVSYRIYSFSWEYTCLHIQLACKRHTHLITASSEKKTFAFSRIDEKAEFSCTSPQHSFPPLPLSLLSVLALSTNILLRSCSACIVVLFIPCFFLARALYSSLAALTTLSAWLMVGFVRYLCLKKYESHYDSFRL